MKSYENDPVIANITAALPAYLRGDDRTPTEEWRRIGDHDVHVDRWEPPHAKATLVLLHGGGGHGRLLSPFARMAMDAGATVLAPDLPGYGLTRSPRKMAIRYDDWRTVAAFLVDRARDGGRPVIVFGLSMGGLLAYDAVVRAKGAAALVATCFLDVRDRRVQGAIGRWSWMAGLSRGALNAVPWLTDRMPFPIAWAAKMADIANDPAIVKALLADPRAAGSHVSLGFLRSYLVSVPLMAPEDFDLCPVILAQPMADRWTPLELSAPFFDAIAGPKRLLELENCGHFPIERPGVDQLRTMIEDLVEQVAT